MVNPLSQAVLIHSHSSPFSLWEPWSVVALAGALIMTAGMALIYILDVDSTKAKYIGAEVLFGFGIGLCNQVPMTAVQGFSKPDEVASATGIMVSKY
jgi:hypothetical protein